MDNNTLHIIWLGPNHIDDRFFKSYLKYLPDFEMKIWNEQNFYSTCRYYNVNLVKRNWAFASDYLRFKVLYEYGGLYVDTDVEMIKQIPSEFFNNSFLATEKGKDYVASGLIMYFKEKHHPVIKYVMDYYESYKGNKYITDGDLLCEALQWYGDYKMVDQTLQIKDIVVYSSEYFSPINLHTKEKTITENTYSIHWYANTWKNAKNLNNNIQYFTIK